MIKHGIYYAFWEQQWRADYHYYIEKAARLGFDILEIAASPLPGYSAEDLERLRRHARDAGIILTCGHGPSSDQNLASADPAIRENAKSFFTDLLKRLEKLDIHVLGGGIYSYWPVDFSQPINKPDDWKLSVEGVREMGHIAEICGVNYCLEVLNRFEGYLLNTSAEAVSFVDEVSSPAVKIMLDTFHMNIEEDSIGGAIRLAGDRLGHFHTGECNRRAPGKGRTPWHEIGDALRDISYQGYAVMEPFIRMGGQVGQDIKIWRDISEGAVESTLDELAREAVIFQRYMLG